MYRVKRKLMLFLDLEGDLVSIVMLFLRFLRGWEKGLDLFGIFFGFNF